MNLIKNLVFIWCIAGTTTPLLASKYSRFDTVNCSLQELLSRAHSGDAAAQCSLGCKFLQGTPAITQNFDEAFNWFKKSAEQGNKSALCNLGYMYNFGHSVPQSEELALFYYENAARRGDASAQFNCGAFYESNKNYSQAAYWFRQAMEAGEDSAVQKLAYLYANNLARPPSNYDLKNGHQGSCFVCKSINDWVYDWPCTRKHKPCTRACKECITTTNKCLVCNTSLIK